MVQTRPDAYTIKNASINEPTGYAHQSIMPGSINEPLLYPGAMPVLTVLTPNRVAQGSADLTVTVTGTGFGDWSSIMFNNVDVPTNLVSSTQLTMLVKPSTAVKGANPVKVRNGSFLSNILTFTFT